MTLTLYASPTPDLSSASTATLLTVPYSRFVLGGKKSKILKLTFTYPSVDTPTAEYLVALLTTPGVAAAPAEAVTGKPVQVGPPLVAFSPVFSGKKATVNPGHPASATVIVQNIGNISADGTLGVNLYASTDELFDASDSLLISSPARKIHLCRVNRLPFTSDSKPRRANPAAPIS